MTIEQKNTIIAEAMNLPKMGICQKNGQMYGWVKKDGTMVPYPPCKMKFHTSTRWLLKAITSLVETITDEDLKDFNTIVRCMASGSHKKTYEAIVDSIIEEQQNKKKS